MLRDVLAGADVFIGVSAPGSSLERTSPPWPTGPWSSRWPGLFRGLLDAGAHVVDLEMEAAAAAALAVVVTDDQLHAAFFMPSVADPAVTRAGAQAVRASAEARQP